MAKAANIPLDIVTITSSQDAPDSYRKLNPLGKIPTFVGTNGFVLSECIAIAMYSPLRPLSFSRRQTTALRPSMTDTPTTVTSSSPTTTLLGSTKEDYASILRWMSFANSEILPALGGWFNPLIGRQPFIQEQVDANRHATLQRFQMLEEHLTANQAAVGGDSVAYLVGGSLTLADLFVTGIVAGAFMFFLDGEWRAEHPKCTRWFERVAGLEMMEAVVGKAVLAEKAMPSVPPAKRE